MAPRADDPLSMAAAAKVLPHLRRQDLDAYLAKVRVKPGSLAHLCMWDRYDKKA